MSNLALEVEQVSAWLKAPSHTVRKFLLSVWNLLGINDQLSHYAGSQNKTGLARFKWLHLYMILVLLQDIWALPEDPGGGRTWMDECGNLRYANFVWLIYEVTFGKCFFFSQASFLFSHFSLSINKWLVVFLDIKSNLEAESSNFHFFWSHVRNTTVFCSAV